MRKDIFVLAACTKKNEWIYYKFTTEGVEHIRKFYVKI